MNERRNILYITFLGILEPVAYSQVFSYMVELSRKNNFKFFLLSLEKKEFIARKDYLKIEDMQRTLLVNNVEWRILKFRSGLGKLYNVLECFFYAAFLILKSKVKIIHARSNEPAITAFLLSKIFKVKLLYDRRGIMSEDYTVDATGNFKIKKGGLIYKLLNRLERKIMLSSGAIVVLTDKIYKLMIQDKDLIAKKDALYVIPCCVNLNVYSQFLKNNNSFLSDLNLKDKLIINYTGSLSNLHSLTEMLDFFKVAKEVITNVHFMFLTLEDKVMLQQQLKLNGLNIEDFTIIAASPLKVNEYLSICDATAMFFKPTLNRLCASPTRFAECLASGLPVIINKGIGDTETLIKENKVGVVIKDFSEPAYLEALKRLLELLNEPDIRLRCRKTAQAYFPLQLGTRRYRKIYENLLV